MPLDLGIGLVLGVFLNVLTRINLTLCLGLGIIAALMPDLDYVYSALKTKHLPDTSHRDGWHYPLIFIPLFGSLGWLINPSLGLIFALGSFLHFVHDSVGIGWGIKWLYPFRKNSYLFLFQIKTPTNIEMPKKRFYSWNDEERLKMSKKYGFPGWIRYVYFQPNPWGIFEYAGLVVGIMIAIVYSSQR